MIKESIKKAQEYSKEDKLDMVLAVLQEPQKATAICEKYGIGMSTLGLLRNSPLEQKKVIPQKARKSVRNHV
jgi:transposase-like protein